MLLARRLSFALAFAALCLLPVRPAGAQCVSLTTLGSAATQNFDTLSNVAGSTTNNLTITGWFMTESGGGARDNEQYAVDTGASTTGDTYSYGAAASTERALGQLRSGTLIPNFGACFTNNTGATITSLAVAYNGEEWRLGTAGRTDQMNFEYSTNATDLVTGTWTNVAALNFVTPDTATTGAKNGNAAADRTALSSTISALSIPNGATFWIRWNDTDATGADDGLAVDDLSLTPNGVVVLPNLTINDVPLNEGNAGTTSFTFTVSLPAGRGDLRHRDRERHRDPALRLHPEVAHRADHPGRQLDLLVHRPGQRRYDSRDQRDLLRQRHQCHRRRRHRRAGPGDDRQRRRGAQPDDQ